jgi:uncharacterized membrane protein YidH (DUF202 family)
MPEMEMEERAGLLGESRLSQQLAYDTFEQHTLRNPPKMASDEFTDTFLRKTFKFWVLPSNFLTVKRRITQHVPEWRYDGKKSPSLAESGCVTNSLYFDNDALELYNYRILQIEDSMLFRYRWYSDKKPTKGFMEQKLRQPKWRCLPSVKQRFQLDPALVTSYIAEGESAVPLKEPIVGNIHDYMRRWGELRHTIRSEYRRTVFQSSNGDDVRMSFDEDVTLLDVSNLSWEDACDPGYEIPFHKIFHFPLGILEVKLAFEKFDEVDLLEMPVWVLGMQQAGLIIQVEKFSKYCTGAAIMNLHTISRVPSWIAAVRSLLEVELARRGREWFQVEKDPQWEIIAQNAIHVPERVEPREFLANERTMLKWVRMCFLALFVGLALLGFQHEPVTGIILTLCSMVILFRAFYMYQLRQRMLIDKNFDHVFYDPYGPVMIMVLFVVPALTYLMFCLGVFDVTPNDA